MIVCSLVDNTNMTIEKKQDLSKESKISFKLPSAHNFINNIDVNDNKTCMDWPLTKILTNNYDNKNSKKQKSIKGNNDILNNIIDKNDKFKDLKSLLNKNFAYFIGFYFKKLYANDKKKLQKEGKPEEYLLALDAIAFGNDENLSFLEYFKQGRRNTQTKKFIVKEKKNI